MAETVIDRAARATPPLVAQRVKGLSDRAIAWIFVAPTIFILLAINIFPLIWTIYLSFTNFRVNRPNNAIEWVGLRNYERILGDPDVWVTMQATAHFLFWTIVCQVLIGFTLAYLINKKFRGNDLWTTIIVFPMMLSPAVVGNFWTFLYQPQIGLFNYIVGFVTGADPSSFSMIGEVSLAMTNGIGLGKVANSIHPYPTQAEAIRKAGDLYNKTRLTPRVKSLLEWWLKRPN